MLEGRVGYRYVPSHENGVIINEGLMEVGTGDSVSEEEFLA